MSAQPSDKSFSPPVPAIEDRLTGLVPFIIEAETDRGDPEVFVAAATAPAADKLNALPDEITTAGSGAGLTFRAAQKATLGECVERYSFSIVHPEDLIFGPYSELSKYGFNPVAPQKFALFHPAQYPHLPFDPFDTGTPIAWAHADSLTNKEDRLVPACMVYIPYYPHFQEQGEKIIANAISTGGACATSRVEGMLKGVCELVERDAVMIMWRNRLALPRVNIDPASALYPIFQEKFARPGLRYTLVYTSLDLAVPSFFGILVDERSGSPSIMVGGAAHPDPSRAALKTLLELVQSLKWKDHMGCDVFEPEPEFRNVRSFDDRARLYASNDLREAFRFLWDHPHEIPLSSIPSLDTGDHRRNLDHCIALLAERDLEVIALDLTPVDADECGLYVTKVIIPGIETMEGDYQVPFLGGWRWREVPVRLGLLENATDLQSVNPYPHPYP